LGCGFFCYAAIVSRFARSEIQFYFGNALIWQFRACIIGELWEICCGK
jgi:hypothetical protein